MSRAVLSLLAFVMAAPLAAEPQLPTDLGERIEAEREFMKMAVPRDEPEACAFERAPRDLGPTAYLRNGYAAMRKILAMERWEETGSCECFYDDITWDEAVAAADRYVTSSDPGVPFSVYDMQQVAEDLIRQRAEACGG